MQKHLFLFTTLLFFSIDLYALSADEIAKRSYHVNQTSHVKNMMIKKKKRSSIIVVSRSVGVKPRINAVERFLTNAFDDGKIQSKDMVIMRSGKLNGIGILMTSYHDPKRSHEFMMWFPALRKVRRMAEPEDAGLGAGDIAFLQDAKLRRLHEDSYTLLKTEVMDIELRMMPYKKGELGRFAKGFPYKKITKIPDRKVYVLKSTSKKKKHWYDHRISYIDTEYFTDYMTKYYKEDKLIKEVHRHWMDIKDKSGKRSKMWYYWYSKDTKSGYEMVTYIPKKLVKIDQKVKRSFWSTRTLEKIKR